MKKFWMNLCGSLLVTAIFLSAACACAPRPEPTVEEADATYVRYSSNGEYSTTITRRGGDFEGISKDDVTVRYYYYTHKSGLGKEEDGASVDTRTAQVLSAEVNPNGSLDLTFLDPDAISNQTPYYSIYVDKLDLVAGVEVDFAAHSLSCDRDYVLASERTVKLTLTLEEGEFADRVTKDNIILGGSFENMSVESVSAAGKYLTLQLNGDLSLHEYSGVYLDGVVCLAADAVKDHTSSLEARVPVLSAAARLDAGRMRVSHGDVTIPLVLIDVVHDLGALAPSDVVFLEEDGSTASDITVEELVVTGDTEVCLVLGADGVTDQNSAAKLLNGRTVRVKDYEFIAELVFASFYPVFDYVEEKDGKFEFTVELYANNGEFSETFAPSDVSFGGAFEGASVRKLTRTGMTTAELVFSAETGGQSAETLNMNGEIVLAGNTLVDLWGELKDEPTSYTRNYSKDSLGRDYKETALTVFQKAREFGAQFSNVIRGVTGAYNTITTILNLTGLVPSAQSQMLKLIEEIKEQLNRMEDLLQEQNQLLKAEVKKSYEDSLSPFDTNVIKIEQACGSGSGNGTPRYGLDGYLEEALGKVDRPSGNSDAEWERYSQELVSYMKQYTEYNDTVTALRNTFDSVVAELSKTNNENPLYLFDVLCTKTYNFDTTSVGVRRNYRGRVEYVLERALSHLLLYYVYGDGTVNENARNRYTVMYQNVMKQIEGRPVTDPAEKAKGSSWKDDAVAYSYVLHRDISLNYRWRIGRTENASAYGVKEIEEGTCSIEDMLDHGIYGCWSFSAVGPQGYGRAINEWTNADFDFTPTQQADFVERMQGRTLRQELELSGFPVGEWEKADVGLIFWIGREWEGWNWWGIRHWVNYYADMMLWDETAIARRRVTYEADNRKIEQYAFGFIAQIAR